MFSGENMWQRFRRIFPSEKTKEALSVNEQEPFVRFVIEKVAPRVREGRAGGQLAETAGKRLKKGMGTHSVERLLFDFGTDSAMLSALGFAAAVRDATGTEPNDIMYGDCYLASVYCMATETRHRPEVDVSAMEVWLPRFQTDIDYLLFANRDQLEDLVERGPGRFEVAEPHEAPTSITSMSRRSAMQEEPTSR